MDSLSKPPSIKPKVFLAREKPRFPEKFELGTYSNIGPKKARNKSRMFIWIFAVFFLVIFSMMSFLFYKSLRTGRSIQIRNADTSIFSDMKQIAFSYFTGQRAALKGESTGRVNILLLGRAGKNYPGKNLTDTVIMMSIDTTQKKVALLSLPRDLYAPITGTALFTKINSLYQYGLNQGIDVAPLRSSVEEITGQTIHYFFVLDFDGFEKIVDTLGGVPVNVLRDFYDPRYPGKNYSYETFEIKKGWQTLDGATALKYVRERHNDPEGDFGRAKRQQQLIQAIKDKSFSLGTFFNIFTVNSLLDTLEESVKTDMTLDEMESFIKLAKILDTENVSSIVVNAWQKGSLLRVSHVQVGNIAAFILVPRVGNWSEINDLSTNIFHLDALDIRRKRIAEEQATLIIFSSSKNASAAEKIKRLSAEMGFTKVSVKPLPNFVKNKAQSVIIDRSGLKKPFSLDELIKKFSLQKTADPPNITISDTYDFAIIMGSNLTDALSFDEKADAIGADDTLFSEWLAPQTKKSK